MTLTLRKLLDPMDLSSSVPILLRDFEELTGVYDSRKIISGCKVTRVMHVAAVVVWVVTGDWRLRCGDVWPRELMSAVFSAIDGLPSRQLIVRIVGLWYSPRGLRWRWL